jgi:hypothetical protein
MSNHESSIQNINFEWYQSEAILQMQSRMLADVTSDGDARD